MMLRRFILIGLPLVALFAVSSATHARLLHESSRIALYRTKAEPGNRNSHPITLETDQLSAALSRMRARSGETGEIIDLFPEKNHKESAKQLAKALERIDADQELHLVSLRRDGTFFSGHRNASAARVFMEGGRLNLIFGQVDRYYSEFRDPDKPVPAMGSRKQATSLKGSIIHTEGVTFVDGRNDWVALDLIQAAPAPPVVSNDGAPDNSGEGAGVRPEQRVPSTWEELEEGLSVLQRLHSKGLITDQEYSAKKKEMLDAVKLGK